MAATQRTFDGYLHNMRAASLKIMARHWGGHSQMRKDECIAAIQRGLASAVKVKTVIGGLSPYERTALAILKQYSGEIEIGALAVGLLASGVSLPSAPQRSDWLFGIIQPLIRRGLILSDYASDPSVLYSGLGERRIVFSDERLLAHIGPPGHVPFDLAPAQTPIPSIARRPQAVILDIIGILQAIENLGGLSLTRSGTLQVNAARKLAAARGWEDDALKVDGLALPQPVTAFMWAFRHAGLLALQGDSLVLAQPIAAFVARPYHEQVWALARGFVQAWEWSEWPEHPWFDRGGERQSQGRVALLEGLACLPHGEGAFLLGDFDAAIFGRLGEHFSLYYPPQRPYAGNKPAEQASHAEAEWRDRLRTEWVAREKEWFRLALSSWAYFLGLVELGIEGSQPRTARLTDLGRAVLLGQQAQPAQVEECPTGGSWIIQPNFDMIVYLDRVQPERLAFLERHAERVQAQEHVAQYRITRESIYRGLESGTSLQDLIAELEAGAAVNVPQNVLTDIREWAMLRDRATVRRRVTLLEFPDEAARQAALDRLQGTPVGDRFLIPGPAQAVAEWAKTRIDYARPLPNCLSVDEDGTLHLVSDPADLMILAQLERWAERVDDKTWRLTAASVSRTVETGTSISDLRKCIQERLIHPLPPLLAVALRAWAGDRPYVEMSSITVLRCNEHEVFEAITSSPTLKPYLRGELAPDVLLVDSRQVDALKERLNWAGLKISNTFVIERKKD